MFKINNYSKINHNNILYAVGKMEYKKNNVPVLLDWNDYNIISKLDKKWSITQQGMVCTKQKDNRIIYLHDVVMNINNLKNKLENQDKSILHINRLGIDNRFCNLMYDSQNKEITKNLNKKKRIINLKGAGIDVDKLPSFVWYLKQNDTHGERFMVSIGDLNWKSSSSKFLSLKYKFEETKKYLRHLRQIRKDLFDEYSMNGDLNYDGKQLIKSYSEICTKGDFIINSKLKDNTDYYFIENLKGLKKNEIELLNNFEPNIYNK